MSKDANRPKTCCGGSLITSLRMITLPDGSRIGVTGLDEIFQDLYQSKKEPDADTVREIVNRLEKKNYIPPRAREGKLLILLVSTEQIRPPPYVVAVIVVMLMIENAL